MEKSAVCRICASERFELRFEKNGFRIDKCLQCSLIQVTNPPQSRELESYYDEDFFDKYYQPLQKDAKRQGYEYKKFNYRLQEIEKRVGAKGRILDVGCSFGFFLDAAQRRGWQSYGIEISAFAANYAKAHFGLTVVNKPLGEADFGTGFFDVVTLWNVIEHLLDPVTTVRQLSRMLKSGGMLVLTTGNVESLLARTQKGRWRMLIPPIHLTHFSPVTIKYLLESCNMEQIEQTLALPYEALLKSYGFLELCKKIGLSDKMLVYAKKPLCPNISYGRVNG